MKYVGFQYVVKATVSFSGREIAQLRRFAFRHYDVACRATVIPGEKAFLNGLSNSATPLEAHQTIPAKDSEFNDIGLMMKIQSVLREINEESRRLNDAGEPT